MPDKRGFKRIALNIVHLTCHIDELRVLMYPQLPDLLVLNESKLDSTIDDEDVKIKGYEIIRHDRTRHGGGICIYLKSCFSYSDSAYKCFLHPSFEIICFEIRSNSKPFVIVACYRPPKCDNSFFEHLEMIITKLDNDDKEYIILGDLNSDLLPINNCTDSNVRLLKSLIEVFQLSQLITEPTTVTEKSKTLLDVIITNKPERILVSGTNKLGTSDHDLVYLASTISSTSKHFTDYVISSSAVFSFGTISNKTVHDFLSKFPINKSTGLDNLSCRLLRDAAPIISQSLCDLFNKSLVLGVFPSDWKVAKVFPLHKGQSKSDPNNYRPISILSSVSKIFEKIVSLNFMIISMKMTFCPRLNQAFDPFTRQPRLCFMPLMSGSITSIKAC